MKNELETGIGSRLERERTRLGLTDEAMAKVGEITLITQRAHESGVHTPTALYLNRIAGVGVDVRYVVVGTHSGLSATPLDWEVVTKIVDRISTWAKTQNSPPPLDARARMAAVFFDLYRVTGVLDSETFHRVLAQFMVERPV